MPVVEISQTVDARGLSCPMPIVKTAQAVKALASGAVDRAPRDRRRLRQGRRRVVPDDRQHARRPDLGRRGLPLRHPPEVRLQP